MNPPNMKHADTTTITAAWAEMSIPTRLHRFSAAGNDFLVGFVAALPTVSSVAEVCPEVCGSIDGGADGLGLVVLCCPAGGVVSAETRFWHPDGSLVRLSGDGLLCVSHAAAIASGVEDLVIKVRTDAGPKRCAAAAEAGSVMVEATLGVAKPGPLPDLGALSPPAAAGCGVLRWDTFDVGGPHIVCEVVDIDAADVGVVGEAVAALFAGGVSVHLMAAGAGNKIELRSWAGGARRFATCGAGAVAAAAALRQWGRAPADVVVHTSRAVVGVSPARGGVLSAASQLAQTDAAVLDLGTGSDPDGALFDTASYNGATFDGSLFAATQR